MLRPVVGYHHHRYRLLLLQGTRNVSNKISVMLLAILLVVAIDSCVGFEIMSLWFDFSGDGHMSFIHSFIQMTCYCFFFAINVDRAHG